MTSLRHLRSDTANKRPDPAALSTGQVAINYESGSPGLFFKDSAGNLVKAGPVHIGTSAPNATPAAGGSTGNAVGEFWLDTTGGANDLKIWSGSAWVSTSGEYVNVTGDTMTGDLTLDNANIVFEGSTADTFETTLTVADPTADNTITLPNVSGTVVTTGDTGSVTSAMIADATIVNADISASAEIAVSKLADGSARQLLQTDAAGTGVEWTSNVDVPGTLDVTGAATFDSTASVTGDLAVNTNTLFVDASANAVGIGTASPQSALSISKNGEDGIEFVPQQSTSTNQVLHYNRLTSAYSIVDTRAAQHLFRIEGTERARIDSAGRLLVGTSSSSAQITALFQGNSGGSTSWGALNLARGTTSPSSGQSLGELSFSDSGHDIAGLIACQRDGGTWTSGSSQPTRLVFSTTADGASSPTEHFRISSAGELISVSVYNNTSAVSANMAINSSGKFLRATSSVKYKTSVETLQDSYADALLSCRPVWYRSTCAGDNPDWGWWGFIAEEVSQIDERLVTWGKDEDGNLREEGVQYDRFVPHLLNLIKRQKEQIESQGASIAALEARLSALESA